MNLIRDPWIPVVCASGEERIITPWQVSGVDTDIPVRFQGPRTDFNGIYAQFLIGLVQTASPPSDKKEWRRGFREIPPGDALKKKFERFEPCFNLFDETYPFMQDLSVKSKENLPVGRLLLEMPGENAEKNNTDHFLKRGSVSRICPRCAAAALMSLQTNASFGGAGHRVGLRGGGPLTTLVKGRTLWELIWLNVMSSDEFLRLANPDMDTDAHRFAWCGEGEEWRVGRECTPLDAPPAHMFWGTPRRIRLNHEAKTGFCDICGVESDIQVTSFQTERNGIVYKGGWMHPLSPHRRDRKTNEPYPEHMQPGGIRYHDWLGLIQNHPEKGTEPAAVVLRFRRSGPSDLKEIFGSGSVPLWSFGYDMDKAKARCYYESLMPIPLIADERREDYDLLITSSLLVADLVLGYVRDAIRRAWYESPKNAPSGDMTSIDLRFWQETEADFHDLLMKASESPVTADGSDSLKLGWLSILQKEGMELFDEYSQYDQIDVADPRRISRARRYLRVVMSEKAKKIRSLLMVAGPLDESQNAPKKVD